MSARSAERRGARGRSRSGRFGRGRLGRPARARRAAGRRGALPSRQGLRRRPDPAGDGRARPPRASAAGRAGASPTAGCGLTASARCSSCPGRAGTCPTTGPRCRAPSSTTASGRSPSEAGARMLLGARAVDVRPEDDDRSGPSSSRPPTAGSRSRCRWLVVADGVRSPLGRLLGRTWHRETAYGVAARGYVDDGARRRLDLHRHLELRGEQGELLSGYGWIFPLGGGRVNVGVGTLATAKRPANVSLKPLMRVLRRRSARGVRARARGAGALVGAAADGRGGQRRGRAELAAGRRRRRLREPAERRGHRLRAGDRTVRGRPPCGGRGPGTGVAGAAAPALRRRRSASPGAWPA